MERSLLVTFSVRYLVTAGAFWAHPRLLYRFVHVIMLSLPATINFNDEALPDRPYMYDFSLFDAII